MITNITTVVSSLYRSNLPLTIERLNKYFKGSHITHQKIFYDIKTPTIMAWTFIYFKVRKKASFNSFY